MVVGKFWDHIQDNQHLVEEEKKPNEYKYIQLKRECAKYQGSKGDL